MGAHTLEFTTSNFEKEVLQNSQPVLVDFWAEWCGPCKMIAPVVDELAETKVGSLVVGKLNADEHQDVLAALGVMSLPTLILFKNGEEVTRVTGFKGRDHLVNHINAHL